MFETELSMEETCANRSNSHKIKTYKENRILVRLRIVDGYVSFANSKCNVNTLLWGNTVNVKNKMRSIFDAIVIYSTY